LERSFCCTHVSICLPSLCWEAGIW